MFRYIITFIFLAFSSTTHAVEFDIYQSNFEPLQVAWLLQGKNAHAYEEALLSDVVEKDLVSSQSFKMLNPLSFIADADTSFQRIDYNDWRIIGSNVLILCKLTKSKTIWKADVQLHDPFRGKILGHISIKRESNELRLLAHEISNYIYKTMMGTNGHFQTHLLYVKKYGRKADLMYMDQDGHNLQAIGSKFTLLLSPDWSPNGRFVALNTYVGNRPRLEIFDLSTGKRNVFGHFKGLNSSPSYSPDGRYIAAALSHTGNVEIHIYDLKKETWRQFTHNQGIDTTPTWSPDGQWIAFTSNRSGNPQVYRKPIKNGKAERITNKAPYNTSPAWSPKGDRIAIITLKKWKYALATMKTDGTDLRYLATGKQIESPAWSPNGQMLLYSAETDGIRRVYRVPSWGGTPEAITPANIDASDPAWSH